MQGDYRNIDTGRNTVRCWIFATAPVALRPGPRLAAVTLPVVGNLHVFAVADNGGRPT